MHPATRYLRNATLAFALTHATVGVGLFRYNAKQAKLPLEPLAWHHAAQLYAGMKLRNWSPEYIEDWLLDRRYTFAANPFSADIDDRISHALAGIAEMPYWLEG